MRKTLLLAVFLSVGQLMAGDSFLYTNGVWMTHDKCRLTAEHFEREYLGGRCEILYNPTTGRVKDVWRAIRCWCGMEHPAVERHVRYIEMKVAEMGPADRLVWLAHSEGVFIADQALDQLDPQVRKKICVHAFGGARRIARDKAAQVTNYVVPGDLITLFAGGLKVREQDRVLFDPQVRAWPSIKKHWIVNGRYERALRHVFGSTCGEDRPALNLVGREYVTRQDLFIYRGADETQLGLEAVCAGPHVPTSVAHYREKPTGWAESQEYRARFGSSDLYRQLEVAGVLPAGTRLAVAEVQSVRPPGMGTVCVPLVSVGDREELVCAQFLFSGGVGKEAPLYPKEHLLTAT